MGACRSDIVHSVITKQILHSTKCRENVIIRSNNSNAVKGSVFGNLNEENNTGVSRGELSVILSVLLTFCHIPARKRAFVPGKKLHH